MTPAISIILPTYNRAKFLPEALDSIANQTFGDWELVVVDDGSTDTTRWTVAEITANWKQKTHYIWRENGGAYAARNSGLDIAQGQYIAFFDSDDLWLPHHLADCVNALNNHLSLDWVYGASRIIDHNSGAIVAPSSFYIHDKPQPFLRLLGQAQGNLHIIDDPNATRCMILFGLFCGLQNSVIRAHLLKRLRFRSDTRNEAEDQLFVVRSLKANFCFGYFDNIHVSYRIHAENSSASANNIAWAKRVRIQRELIRGYEELRHEVHFSWSEQRALNCRLAREYFWHLGYAIYWQNGLRMQALQAFRKGLYLWPWDWRYWKTTVLSLLKFFAIEKS